MAGLQVERAEQQPSSDATSGAVESHDATPSPADGQAPLEGPQQTPDPAELGACAASDSSPCAAPGVDSASHQEPWSAAAAGPHKAIDDLEDCPECIICWDANASVVLQPCGHLCVCLGCVELLRGAACPMCRGQVLSKVTTKAAL